MDELQERAEIDRLVEEQLKDDTDFIEPQFPNTVSTDVLDDLLGITGDGEVISFKRAERGSILTGAASWHGSTSGYVNHKCRCRPCKDAQAARIRKQRERRKAAQ